VPHLHLVVTTAVERRSGRTPHLAVAQASAWSCVLCQPVFNFRRVRARPLGRLVIRTTLQTVAHDTHTHTRKDTGVSHGVDTSTTNTLVRECAHRKRELGAGERGGREGVAEGPLASSAEGSEREEGVFYSRWKQNTQAHTATPTTHHTAQSRWCGCSPFGQQE